MKRAMLTIGGVLWLGFALGFTVFLLHYLSGGAGLPFFGPPVSCGSVLLGLAHLTGFVAAIIRKVTWKQMLQSLGGKSLVVFSLLFGLFAGWGIYAGLIACILGSRSRAVYRRFFMMLCVLLLLNVAGCHAMLYDLRNLHIGC